MTMNKSTIKGLIIGVLAGVTIGGIPAMADDEPATDTGYWGLAVPHYQRYLVTPCKTEGSNNCYWDARSFGNKKGHSYYVIPVGHKWCIQYWEPRYNRRHGYCEPK